LTSSDLGALSARLKRLPGWYRHYGWWKVRMDPVYPLALAHLAEAREIRDLGAGMGLMAALLCQRSPGVHITAIEWDARKADVARKFLEGLSGAEVVAGDARRADLGTCRRTNSGSGCAAASWPWRREACS